MTHSFQKWSSALNTKVIEFQNPPKGGKEGLNQMLYSANLMGYKPNVTQGKQYSASTAAKYNNCFNSFIHSFNIHHTTLCA